MRHSFIALLLLIATSSQAQTIFFHESFDDASFTSRGWYDNTSLAIDKDVHAPGSASSVRFVYEKGTKAADGGMRHPVPETDAVYLSYWVKYSENWVGSNKPYHPHEFHFMTNLNDKWRGPAFSHLTLYIEQNEGHPMLAIQDGENIDQTKIKIDLTDVTENRAVAGCNGNTDGYNDDCYLGGGGLYVNGKSWKSSKQWFSDVAGPEYKADWHHVEAYFKLNSIIDGKGVTDGVVQYWYDGQTVLDHRDVLLRTGQYPEMRFNQFLIAPYIGDGSPIDQTMWVDEMTVGDARPASGVLTFDDKATPSLAVNVNSIDFTLHKASEITLEAMDVLGRVTKLYQGSFPPGVISVPYSRELLALGVYHLLLRDNFSTIASAKVMIVR
jgi:hypothetical protein